MITKHGKIIVAKDEIIITEFEVTGENGGWLLRKAINFAILKLIKERFKLTIRTLQRGFDL